MSYAYQVDHQSDLNGGCSFTSWISEQHFGWIDLGASVQTRGTTRSGEGSVTRHSLPSIDRFKTANGFRQKEFEVGSYAH